MATFKISVYFLLLVIFPAWPSKGNCPAWRGVSPVPSPAQPQWNRFVTEDGVDFSVSVNKHPELGILGNVIIGSTKLTRNTSKDEAQEHVVKLDIHSGKIRRDRLTLYGRAPYNPSHTDPRRFSVVIQLVPSQRTLDLNNLNVESVILYEKPGWLHWKWYQAFEMNKGSFSRQSADFNARTIRGDLAREIYQVLIDGHVISQKALESHGLDYRGLWLAPYPGEHPDEYAISFAQIEVPSQLIDALNGLRSLGLREDHPIFERMPQ